MAKKPTKPTPTQYITVTLWQCDYAGKRIWAHDCTITDTLAEGKALQPVMAKAARHCPGAYVFPPPVSFTLELSYFLHIATEDKPKLDSLLRGLANHFPPPSEDSHSELLTKLWGITQWVPNCLAHPTIRNKREYTRWMKQNAQPTPKQLELF